MTLKKEQQNKQKYVCTANANTNWQAIDTKKLSTMLLELHFIVSKVSTGLLFLLR